MKEEEIEGDEGSDNADNENGNKPKESSTPLWKYETRYKGGKGGGTTKFSCPRCKRTYIGSYTHVRKHLHGIIPSDEKKSKAIGVKTCNKVLTKNKENKSEEGEAENKSKKSKVKYETSHRMFGG
jgi:hypothetical protein